VKSRIIAATLLALAVARVVGATEPNETFESATILSAGVLSVADELSAAPILPTPDTVLGVRDLFGSIYATDDDGSPLGDGSASGLGSVPTNSGSIDFAISGYDDFDFSGAHSEEGYYEVFVDVYDFFGDPVDQFSEVHLLEPGTVDDFYYSDAAWISGFYDVYIDNTVGAGGANDVDFFTYTGLTPGAEFTVRTVNPALPELDTYLGWFDSNGGLLDTNDDIDVANGILLSQLEGTVPPEGMLTFAVTGYGDVGFVGNHQTFGSYELQLELASAGLLGDYNGNDEIDAADYTAWRDALTAGATTLANDPTPGTVDESDFLYWRDHFGEALGSGAGSGAAAVPESASLALLLMAIALQPVLVPSTRDRLRRRR